MTDHHTEATRLIDALHDWQEREGETDTTMLTVALEAQAQATLELANQQRISNLIALADPLNPRAETQIVADARDALTEFHPHDDETLGGWVELRPEIARTLRIETP